MKQQTAVEWLEKAFYKYAESTGINNNKWLIDEEDLDRLIEQAKQMEKEQIIEAAADHCYPTCELAKIDAEDYYNQTFKKD